MRGVGFLLRCKPGCKPRSGAGAALLALALAACSGPTPPLGWSGPFDVDAVRAFMERTTSRVAPATPPAVLASKSRVLLYPPPPAAPIEATFSLWQRGDAQERREITTTLPAARTVVQVIDGDRFVELEQGVPTGRDLRDEIRVHRRYRTLVRDLIDGRGEAITLAEPPGADLRKTIVLDQSDGRGERWQLWLDAATGLPQRIRRLTRDDSGDHVDEDRLDDWARFGERLLPHHSTTWRDGRRVMESWLLERDETSLLDAALFELPAAR
jgi:hypothetical protein